MIFSKDIVGPSPIIIDSIPNEREYVYFEHLLQKYRGDINKIIQHFKSLSKSLSAYHTHYNKLRDHMLITGRSIKPTEDPIIKEIMKALQKM